MVKKRNTKGETTNGGSPASAPRKQRFTLKPSKQTCAVLGGLMAVTLVAAVGLYIWQSSELAAVEQKVKEKRDEVASGEKIAQRLTQVENDYANMQGQLRYLETSVTAGQYVPTLLKQMEGLAKSVNLKVASVRPALEPAPPPPTDKEKRKDWKPWPYDKLHVDMEVSGSYWDVARMLYRLTEFPKIMAVQNLQINPQASGGGYNSTLSVKMKVTGFIFPNDGQPHGEGGQPASQPAPAKSAQAGATAQTSNVTPNGMPAGV
jgi:Tfp pilus assembly protein PilO